MGYASIPPSSYTSMLRFTIDGRPAVEDIHYLFSILISQVAISVHKHMFKTYQSTFTSEDAISQLCSQRFSKAYAESNIYSSTTNETYRAINLNKDMSKALIQQFLWSRLIENAVEITNKSYKDKGIWRLTSKGLCILQDFCQQTKKDIYKYSNLVNATSNLIFLVHIERFPDNDRINTEHRFISSLFAILIASLPIQQTKEIKPAVSRYNFNLGDDSSSVYSFTSRELTFPDFFPFIRILPNDVLVGSSLKYTHQRSHQQKTLLKNLNPTSNRFKMRTIFTSWQCCLWLVEFCTVASMDDAEQIMTTFLNLGWVSFFDAKYRHCDQVEASKTIALNLTSSGMKVVMDVALENYNHLKQKYTNTKRHSLAPSSIDSVHRSETFILENQERRNSNHTASSKTLASPSLQIVTLMTASNSSSSVSTPILEASLYGYGSHHYIDTISALSQHSLNSPRYNTLKTFTPSSPLIDQSYIHLKSILKDDQLQLLFRDFLCANFCVEYLDFWLDHDKLARNFRRQKTNGVVNQRQLLEDAYCLWDIYLKPGTLRELSVDHKLRNDIAQDISQMVTLVHTAALGQAKPMIVCSPQSIAQNLYAILNWFEKVNDFVCCLLVSDFVPRFIESVEYKQAIFQLQETQIPTIPNNNDLDDFPPPPQRQFKETLYF